MSSRTGHLPPPCKPNKLQTIGAVLKHVNAITQPPDSNAARECLPRSKWDEVPLAAGPYVAKDVVAHCMGLAPTPSLFVALFTWIRLEGPDVLYGDPESGAAILATIVEWATGASAVARLHPVHHRAKVYVHGMRLLRAGWCGLAKTLAAMRLEAWVPGLAACVPLKLAAHFRAFDLDMDLDWGVSAQEALEEALCDQDEQAPPQEPQLDDDGRASPDTYIPPYRLTTWVKGLARTFI